MRQDLTGSSKEAERQKIPILVAAIMMATAFIGSFALFFAPALWLDAKKGDPMNSPAVIGTLEE